MRSTPLSTDALELLALIDITFEFACIPLEGNDQCALLLFLTEVYVAYLESGCHKKVLEHTQLFNSTLCIYILVP